MNTYECKVVLKINVLTSKKIKIHLEIIYYLLLDMYYINIYQFLVHAWEILQYLHNGIKIFVVIWIYIYLHTIRELNLFKQNCKTMHDESQDKDGYAQDIEDNYVIFFFVYDLLIMVNNVQMIKFIKNMWI